MNAYHQASEEQKALLENMFGKDMFQPKNIMERVKAFEDLHKDYVPRIKDMHVDVDKITNGEIKCE